MIKLRPIVNNILLEDEGDGVTWGNVRKFLEAIQKESKTKVKFSLANSFFLVS